jgi:hypothetical protein
LGLAKNKSSHVDGTGEIMLDKVAACTNGFSLESKFTRIGRQSRGDRWQLLAESTILVLGSPRSGTTWLAKIFDSHPNILYRHEPDELTPATPGLDPATQVSRWLRQRRPRAAAKRPLFRKSWRPEPFDGTRKALAAMIAVTQRIPALSAVVERISLPDMVVPNRWRSVRAMIKLVHWDGSHATRTLPNLRCIFILRHPCGQVASVMAGVSDRFRSAPDMEAAAVWAERHGVGGATFAALPQAAKYAWSWRAFNEPVIEALRDLPNARIVIYEDLCRRPAAVSRDLFTFAGLDWCHEAMAFLGTSTQHDRPAGYYDVYRSTALVAERWRETMSMSDQDAVRTVLSRSSLARCWPDLATTEA